MRAIFFNGEYEIGWRKESHIRHGFSVKYTTNDKVRAKGLYENGFLKQDGKVVSYDKKSVMGKEILESEFILPEIESEATLNTGEGIAAGQNEI